MLNLKLLCKIIGSYVTKREQSKYNVIGARKLLCFSTQSEVRTAATVWNWSGKTLSPGALLAVLYFLHAIFFRPISLSLAPTICPWVSEDEQVTAVGMSLGLRENWAVVGLAR